MAKQMWIVNAAAPDAERARKFRLVWDYSPTYFPRRFYYMKDAIRAGSEAKARGGTNVTVVKEGTS